MSAAWHDDRRNLAAVARHMGERGDTVEDVAYMLEKPEKFADDWQEVRGERNISCPSCDRDLSYPGQPGHECYTYAEWGARCDRRKMLGRLVQAWEARPDGNDTPIPVWFIESFRDA